MVLMVHSVRRAQPLYKTVRCVQIPNAASALMATGGWITMDASVSKTTTSVTITSAAV